METYTKNVIKERLYETIFQHDGVTDYSRHSSLSAAKKWMRERPGSKGHVTIVYVNGDWKPCREIFV